MFSTLLALSASFVSVCNGFPSADIAPAHRLNRRADPEDLSWIKNYASVGDSYSAGIGSGSKNGGVGDYFCSRYDQSFPALINKDESLGDPNGRTFTYWPCSGAVTDGVIKQTEALADGSQDVITITSGGNDALLSEILNECVYQWNSKAVPFHSYCDDKLNEAQGKIDSGDLHSKIDTLISTAKAKLKEGGKVYYVGYAGFWGQDDSQCDSITWAFWYVWGKREYLLKDKRAKMNGLVQNMNNVLADAVARAGDSVTFIDYNKYYADALGRFCEDGYPETSPNRAGLLFYEWDTDDSADETTGTTASIAAETAPGPWNVSPGLVMNGTFEGQINEWVRQALADNPDWAESLPPSTAAAPDPGSVGATDEQLVVGYSSNILPDGYGRVFHPRPLGHRFIADLVLYHMKADNAAKQGIDFPPEAIEEGTCPVNADAAPPPPTTDESQCDTNALSSVPYNVFSGAEQGAFDIYAKFCEAVDAAQTTALDWNVDSSGNQKTTSRLMRMKRTPPPNPETYSSFNFELKWEPAGEETCQMSCHDAYTQLSNSPCGHQAAEQNIMTAEGSLEVGCGKYSYKITGEDVPPVQGPPKAELTARYCFPSDAFGDHGDIHEGSVNLLAAITCAGSDEKTIKKDDPSTFIHWDSDGGDPPYTFNISWDEGCEVDVTEMNVWQPLADDPDSTCTRLLMDNYKLCNNGGIGGSITAGCVTYEFKASMDS